MMRVYLIVVACGLLSGCWYTHVMDGIVSTRDVEFGNPAKTYHVDRSKLVGGYDRKHMILLFPFGSPDPQAAIDIALNRVKSNNPVVGLADAHVRFRWFHLLFYGQKWYSAWGYPVYEETHAVEQASTAATADTASPSNHIPEHKKSSKAKYRNRDVFSDLPF